MAQLCQHREEFRQLNTEVIVVGFGTPAQARAWVKETCSPFTMLLDREREIYRLYGLERSWRGTWNIRTLLFYVRKLLSGHRLHGIQGDPIQLGGDFILDGEGIVRLAYPSRYATDRPPLPDLLAILRQLLAQSKM